MICAPYNVRKDIHYLMMNVLRKIDIASIKITAAKSKIATIVLYLNLVPGIQAIKLVLIFPVVICTNQQEQVCLKIL